MWTEPALSDLCAIAEYIAIDKPSAATNSSTKSFFQYR
jgi:plasmid stabilization system protein ParE